MDSEGRSPLRILPQARITSDVFTACLPQISKANVRRKPAQCPKGPPCRRPIILTQPLLLRLERSRAIRARLWRRGICSLCGQNQAVARPRFVRFRPHRTNRQRLRCTRRVVVARLHIARKMMLDLADGRVWIYRRGVRQCVERCHHEQRAQNPDCAPNRSHELFVHLPSILAGF